jgi:transposase
MRTKGTPAELERRRQRAVQAVREGHKPATVARVLGIDRSTIYRWLRQAHSPHGLDAKPVHRTSRLNDAQLAELEELLLEGATAHGWGNDLWTARRVTTLITRHFGLCFHPEHVRKILKRRLGWTSQKPQIKAKEQNQEAILAWLAEEFPLIVAEARDRDAHLVFLDESGFQLTPTVRRTLAPRGQTPILKCWDKRDKISAISAVVLSPQRYLPDLVFELLPDKKNVHAEEVVAFLKRLRERLPRFTVIWDRSRIHWKSRLVRAYLAEHPEIVAEDFPGYAPELNPDEMVWCWVKYSELCNLAAENLGHLRAEVTAALEWLKTHAYMLWEFLAHTKLPLVA